MEIIVEQLGTTHNVLDRQKFRQPQLTLGRAYRNDVILSDEHVDESHAVLQQDEAGDWWLSDRGSLNGIRRWRNKERASRYRVNSGDIFIIGRNKVRLLFPDHPVAATVKIRFSELFLLALGRTSVLVMLVLGFVLYQGLTAYFAADSEVNWSAVANAQLQNALLYIFLAVSVYLLSILFKRGGNFFSHLGLLLLLFFVSVGLQFLVAWLRFNTGSDADSFNDFLAGAVEYLVMFLYLMSIFYLAFHLPFKRRLITSLSLIGLMLASSLLTRWSYQEYLDQGMHYDQTLMAPALLVAQPVDENIFFDRAFATFAEADEKREQELKARDE
ncbi:MAG: hypothetical protein Tsb002_05320 [Wenzhouxiangellaceae bacterium]